MKQERWTVAPWRRPGRGLSIGGLALGPDVAVRIGAFAPEQQADGNAADLLSNMAADVLIAQPEVAWRLGDVPMIADAGDDIAAARSAIDRTPAVALRVVGEPTASSLASLATRCRERGTALVLRLDADDDPAWRRTLEVAAAAVADLNDVAFSVHARAVRRTVEAFREMATLTDRSLLAWLSQPEDDAVSRAKSALVAATLLVDGLVDLVAIESSHDAAGAARDAVALVGTSVHHVKSRRLSGRGWAESEPPSERFVARPAWSSQRVDVGGVALGDGAPIPTFVLTGLYGHDAREWAERSVLGDAAAAGAYIDCRGCDGENTALRQCGVLPRAHADHLPAIVACDPFSADARKVDPEVLAIGDAILVEPCLDWGYAVAAAAERVCESQRTVGVVVGANELADGSDLVEGIARMATRAVRDIAAATGIVPLLSICIWDVGSLVHVVRRACSDLAESSLFPAIVLDAARDVHEWDLTSTATTIGPLLVDGIGDAVRAEPIQLEHVRAIRQALLGD